MAGRSYVKTTGGSAKHLRMLPTLSSHLTLRVGIDQLKSLREIRETVDGAR